MMNFFQLSEINEALRTDPKAFLDQCDEQYHQKVERAADLIAMRVSTCPIVLLSGPSGSGKTTTAMKIAEALAERGIRSQSLSMDN